jgi:hypothetical protein
MATGGGHSGDGRGPSDSDGQAIVETLLATYRAQGCLESWDGGAGD